MRAQGVFISGIGVYLPEKKVSVDAAVRQGFCLAGDTAAQGMLEVAVADDMPAPEMALYAAEDAFFRCGQVPQDTDLVLYPTTWFHGPQNWLPPSYLQDKLVGGDALALEIRQGCNGMFGAMELAASYLLADPSRQSALLVTADNYGTPLMDRWRSGTFIAGDAASAMVLTKEPGFAEVLSVCTVTIPDTAIDLAHSGEPFFPPGITTGQPPNYKGTREAITRQPELKAAAAKRMIKMHQKAIEVFERALSEANVEVDDIVRMATENVPREVVDKRSMVATGVDQSKSAWDYGRTIGHCGASDQVLAFDHFLSSGQLKPGDHFLMLGTAPGVTMSCAVIKILDVPPWLA